MKWKRGAYDGEIIVEITAAEEPYDLDVIRSPSGTRTGGLYISEVGAYDDAILSFPGGAV